MSNRRSVTSWFFDRVILAHPWGVIAGMLCVVAFFGFKMGGFRLDASSETLVLENDADLRYSRLVSSRYGQQDFLVLTYTPKGAMFSAETVETLGRLRDELGALERVSSVVTILDVPLLESESLSIKDLTGELPMLGSPGVDLVSAGAELCASPLYSDLLVSRDGRTTAVFIKFYPDEEHLDLLERRNSLRAKDSEGLLSDQEESELRDVAEQLRLGHDRNRSRRHDDISRIRGIADRYRDRGDLFLGGVSMITNDMITFIRNDLKVFGVGIVVFLIAMLGILFRRKRWIFVPMACCMVSLICMIGLLGWFGWEVTVISSNFISLQLIMTLAISIHLVVYYRELLSQNPDSSNRQLLLDTVLTKLKPCVYAVLTTMAGFGSLVLSDILPVRTFGWMMIGGLVVSLIVTFVLFPSLVMLIGKEQVRDRVLRRFSLTSAFAGFTESHGWLILGLSGAVLILSLIGISRLGVENRFIDYFKDSTEIHQGLTVIDRDLGGTSPLDVIIEFESAESFSSPSESEPDDIDDIFAEFDDAADDEKYWFTSEKMRRIKTVHEYLDALPETGKVLSLAAVLAIAEKLKGGGELDSFELALLYSETSDEFKRMLIDPYVSVENNEVRFTIRVRHSAKDLRRDALLKKIKSDVAGVIDIDGEHVRLAGMTVLYNNMLQSLFSSQIKTLGITVGLLTGMFLVLFRSIRIAVIAMVANLLSIAVVLGFMGWFDIPLDMMTITIGAIGVGIAVDDTIHYIHRFKREFQKDFDYVASMHRCHNSIGHAMLDTSITITIGFSILALSNFVPSVYFGLLTGLAMLIAVVAALTLLPQMLIIAKPFGRKPDLL